MGKRLFGPSVPMPEYGWPGTKPDERHARALALLDRVGDAAAEALIAGTAAVVPVEATETMGEAGWINKEDVDPPDIWRAMLAAGRLDRGGAA
jgi:hypothetical protein